MDDTDIDTELAKHVTSVTLQSLASLPSALVDEACFGVDLLPNIFEKYGYTPETAEVFREHPLWKKLISVRTTELDKEGLTHKARAAMVADAALMSLAKRVVDPNTATSVLLDAYKAVAKNAGYEPKAAEVQAGSAFSVNIILPQMGQQPAPGATLQSSTKHQDVITVEAEPTPQKVLRPYNPAEFEVPD